MKLIFCLFFLSVCALSASQALLSFGQIFGAKTGFAGMQPGQFFRSIVLESEAQKLLANPDLSDDLRLRVLDSVANADQGFTDCASPNVLPWMQIRCSTLQLALSKKELKAIENELTAKAAAASDAAASENSAIGSSTN